MTDHEHEPEVEPEVEAHAAGPDEPTAAPGAEDADEPPDVELHQLHRR